jgi:formylglycine-generating enzyme required for sulfatase activity
MPSGDDMPDTLNELATRNGIPIRPNPDFHKDMERLINGIEQHLYIQSGAATERKAEEERKRAEEERIEREKTAEAKRKADLGTFRDNLSSGGKSPVMVVIPAGLFEMGSSAKEKWRHSNEDPQHKVRINSFALGKFEVTFEEYDLFAAATGRERPRDEGWGRDQRPVINVSWNDVMAYARWLSDQTGEKYRLPTEAEWEYAARSGNMAPWFWGENEDAADEFAWFLGNSKRTTHPVGEKKPNAFGLHDMAGNVYEWNHDCYRASYEGAPDDGSAKELANDSECFGRVLRGGSWFNVPQYVRSAHRNRKTPDNGTNLIGLRLARTL